jgi:hypothetical protein
MTKSNNLRDGMEFFYGEIIENYKAAQKNVMTESKVSSLFKKANYTARIAEFAKVKKAAIKLEIKKVAENSELENDLIDSLNRCRELLKDLCDAQITMQQALKAKADKERKVGMAEYSKIMNDVRSTQERLQKGLHNMDIYYSDWLEEQ